jgi:hypothetical protein
MRNDNISLEWVLTETTALSNAVFALPPNAIRTTDGFPVLDADWII